MIDLSLLADTGQSIALGRILWGSQAWIWPMVAATVVITLIVTWAYWQRSTKLVRFMAASLKILGIAAIALCIVEPLITGQRARPGANLFLVVADNSQSLNVHDQSSTSRADRLRSVVQDKATWLARLGQDFDLRRYLIDVRLRSTDSFEAMRFDGQRSSLATALNSLATQYRGRPIAGIMLLTDGNPTDWNDAAIDWKALPPIYPVVLGEDKSPRDISISRVSVSQTNFETLPITVQAEIAHHGLAGEELVVQLLDKSGKEVQMHSLRAPEEGKPLAHTFQFRPAESGVQFYSVRAVAAKEAKLIANEKSAATGREATFANNTRLAMVDRKRGPYRVLYVGGRPNWEFKFLRRAIFEDDEVQLVGLIRIAKKEPKFSFRGRTGETTNPLFRGFDNQTDPVAEQYDEPVMVRFGTKDQAELRDGFPKAAEDLFQFDAVVLDDVEAEFFTRDQMSLLQQFVSQRGGGLLMLGGQDSFGGGGYARTPIGDMLPVYVEKTRSALAAGDYRLWISREGLLQPWVRLRPTEQEEQKRLSEMPTFRVWNAATSIKPGASVLVEAHPATKMFEGSPPKSGNNSAHPALVVQRFGSGQTAAWMAGDLWRWSMRREKVSDDDLGTAWRQTIRWLVSDVPKRLEIETSLGQLDGGQNVRVRIFARDEKYLPLDNAEVTCQVTTPDGKKLELNASAVEDKSGEYAFDFAPRVSGGYLISATAKAADGSEVGKCETGFVSDPETEEFRELRPNRELLTRLAENTGGEIIELNGLDRFAAGLPNRKIPIMEPRIYPIWHQWPVLGLAMLCLVGEWGLRRWKGMP